MLINYQIVMHLFWVHIVVEIPIIAPLGPALLQVQWGSGSHILCTKALLQVQWGLRAHILCTKVCLIHNTFSVSFKDYFICNV